MTQPSKPTDYKFDGYRVEIVSHNIQKLYRRRNRRLHQAMLENWESRDQLNSWPTGIHDRKVGSSWRPPRTIGSGTKQSRPLRLKAR